MSPIDIECLLVLNDSDSKTIALLKENAAPLIARISQNVLRLHLRVEYLEKKFEVVYPEIKQLIERGNYQNVLFNLDQCGTSKVDIDTISNIAASFTSAEIFYTFGIETLVSFLNQSDSAGLAKQLAPFGVTVADLARLDGLMSKQAWLGASRADCIRRFPRMRRLRQPFFNSQSAGLAILAYSFRQFGACPPRVQ